MQTDSLTDAGEYAPTTSLTRTGGPRYSHDPETLIPTGLYLEPASTNLVTRSNEMQGGNASQELNTTDVVAPDGTNTALRLYAQGDGYRYKFPFGFSTGTSLSGKIGYRLSYWVKKGQFDTIELTNSFRLRWTFSTKSFTNNGDFPSYNESYEEYPNGWFRLSYTIPEASANHTLIGSVYTTTGDTIAYFWGFQLEDSPYATSYIPTSGSSVTRAADTYTSTATTVLDRDGGNKESWFGNRNSSIYLEAGEPQTSTPYQPGTHHTWLNINDQTANTSSTGRNGFWLHISRYQGTGYVPQFDVRGGTATTSVLNVTPSGKFAVRYDDDIPSVLMAANGLSNTNSTHKFTEHSSGTQMSYNNMFIGYNFTWNQYRGYANTTFNRLTVWNKSIDDQQLINITT